MNHGKTSILAGLALLAGLLALPAQARQPSYQEQLRQQAEHECYQDAKRLCDADIPDEAKVTACMARNREALSPSCRKVFDQACDARAASLGAFLTVVYRPGIAGRPTWQAILRIALPVSYQAQIRASGSDS